MIKFKYYKTDEKFQSDVLNSKINTDDIVFVEDLHTITTHGEEFGGTQVQSNWTQSNSEAADYIKNKPTIPAAQIQSDWTLTNTSAKDYIKNKPSLHTVATSGSYSDLTDKPTLFSGNYNDLSNKPSIPDAPGTLDTTQTTAQSTSSNESLAGNIKLHKVSKTGNYNDLLNTPTDLATQTYVDNKFKDAFGIDASGVSALAAVLSDNDYTTGILTQIANKVDKETGKGLSSNDYTTTEKNKLAGIATGATAVTESTVSGWGFTKNTGTLTSETDPVFTASAAYGISSTDISNWNAKQSALSFNSTPSSSNKVATMADISYPVTSVAGKTGSVTLDKSDVGLGNVDNTADSQKSVNYANSAGSAPAHSYIVTQGDNRNDSTYPTDYSNDLIFRGLKLSSVIDSPSSDTYQYLVGLKGWSDSSGGDAWEIAFNNSGINVRCGADNSSWGSWYKLATLSDIPSSLPASDVYSWAKESTKPSYTLDEVTDGSTRKLPTTMVASGSNHAGGLVPDTPSTAGTTKYLREDGTWAEPSSGSGAIDYVVTDYNVQQIDSTIIAQALRKTAQSLTAAEKAQVLTNLGISSQIAAIRNIIVSTSEPTSADGSNGDIWLVYEA